MSQLQGGAGLGLPSPQYLYPTQLSGASRDIANAYQSLPAGEALTIPAGQQLVSPGLYSFIQYNDPINQAWRGMTTDRIAPTPFWSDGQNYRIANLTGCPVAAIVVAGGSSYVQSSTTVTASAGGSTWQAIVGGMVSLTTINNGGSGYGLAPNLFIAEPAAPGVQATGYCTITGGSVTGVTLTNVGAGYQTAPAAVVVPSQFDPNLSSSTGITPATITFALVGSGSIAAVICTNNGAAQANAAAPTLTVAGVGASASVVAVMCSSLTSGSVVAAGAGLTAGAGFLTIGGTPSATPQWTNPAIQATGAVPRPAQGTFVAGGGSLTSVGTIIDGGLFFGTTNLVVEPFAGTIQSSAGSVTTVQGPVTDTIRIMPM